MAATIGRSAHARIDLVVARGADFEAVLRYKTGTPAAGVDLTGWTARAQLRDRPGGTVWVTVTDGHGITLGADGRIRFGWPWTRMRDDSWDARRVGVWDLTLTDPGGRRIRLAEGAVTISQDVTRDA